MICRLVAKFARNLQIPHLDELSCSKGREHRWIE